MKEHCYYFWWMESPDWSFLPTHYYHDNFSAIVFFSLCQEIFKNFYKNNLLTSSDWTFMNPTRCWRVRVCVVSAACVHLSLRLLAVVERCRVSRVRDSLPHVKWIGGALWQHGVVTARVDCSPQFNVVFPAVVTRWEVGNCSCLTARGSQTPPRCCKTKAPTSWPFCHSVGRNPTFDPDF